MLYSEEMCDLLKASYYKSGGDTDFGGEVTWRFSSRRFQVFGGLQHRLGADTLLKARFCSDGTLGASLYHKFSSSSYIQVSALGGVGLSPSFGFGLGFRR